LWCHVIHGYVVFAGSHWRGLAFAPKSTASAATASDASSSVGLRGSLKPAIASFALEPQAGRILRRWEEKQSLYSLEGFPSRFPRRAAFSTPNCTATLSPPRGFRVPRRPEWPQRRGRRLVFTRPSRAVSARMCSRLQRDVGSLAGHHPIG
jgi:hypothetical protein